LKLSGIFLDSEDIRFYPQQNLLSQTLGFVGYKGDKKAGLYGLERYFEDDLAGTSGELREEKDTGGAWIFGSTRQLLPARDGANLVLTVDKTIQFKAENVLKDAVAKHGADGGCVIVVNPKTGAILAMANYPDFNPNEYNKVEDPKLYLNTAVTGNYEPGSVFKPLTMAAAVNENKVGPDTTYEDKGAVVIDNYTIKNSDNKAHGIQTMTQVLGESLNTGVIFAKDQIGNAEFFKYIKRFGFGRETGIELPEMVGNLDNLKADIKVNFATASFGQGISVTPIQLIQAFTALANEGKMMKPYIVQAKITPDGKVQSTEPRAVDNVITSKTANVVSAMLVDVVENGHGKKAGVPGYYIAGKTGTAQVPKKDGRGYEENNNIGSFIGYGPVENPQFLMLVRIDHPRDVTFAETTAAPAFGELAQFILNYYHIPPTRK
jgi:cell division protein FtsI/penicillin-binding protein 2